jgi:hypothetical protein
MAASSCIKRWGKRMRPAADLDNDYNGNYLEKKFAHRSERQ